MRVLLIQPPSQEPLMDEVFMFEPLALEYLSAGLKLDGYDVKILDARIENNYLTILKNFNPDVVGVTAFTNQLNIAKSIANEVKSLFPDSLLVAGGHHATVQPLDFNDSSFNVVVIGEGVYTLREILSAHAQCKSFENIAGVAIPSPDKMIFTAPRSYTQLDNLPFPDRKSINHYRSKYFSEWFKPLASIRTSLGCTARCNFCALWSITNGKYLKRAPENVVKELLSIKDKNIFFCDDESMCDSKRMNALADVIKEAGIKKNYFLYARVDTIVRHPDLFLKWASIGLKQVFVGMEDFSDERLKAMNKGVTSDQQAKAINILNNLGVMAYSSFMVDSSYTLEDFAGLKAYIRELKITYATFTVMTPLPGTDLYKARKGEMVTKEPEMFDMLHALFPTKLPLKVFYEELAKLYSCAVPLHRSLPVLLKFGLHGLLKRLLVFSKFLKKVRAAHLDY